MKRYEAALGLPRAWSSRTLRSARLAFTLLAGFAGLGACSSAAPESRSKTLPIGVVAEVAGAPLRQSMVQSIASTHTISPPQALDRAISDAVFAAEARERLPVGSTATIERAALSRAVLEALVREARAAGAPTDAEVDEVTHARWTDLDRPPSVRVTHAVALFAEGGRNRDEARRVAEAIASSVRGVLAPAAFIRAAQAVPAGSVRVRAERLPFITADGRGISTDPEHAPDAEFDPTFSKAANSLSKVGEQSELVETSFGFHIILLEERLPERRVQLEDRRRALGPEVLARRADNLRRALIQRLRQATPVELSRNNEQETQKLLQ